MITKSKRREYFACHLTMEDRKKLKAEAGRRKTSMSALAAVFISAGLTAAGVKPEPPSSNEVELPLPLEG